MQVPPEQHDIVWLRKALQSAVTLELATLPPYLSAYWSIKDDQTEAGGLIHQVFMEEMLHMGLACNMLTTIGGQPKMTGQPKIAGQPIIPGEDFVPKYPGHLPGGVRPELTVYLAGFSKEIIEVFMQIEFPENGPVALTASQETYPTIGAFYTAILEAFRGLPEGSITGKGQITDSSFGIFAIEKFENVEMAIGTIKEQGEGTSKSPKSGEEMAHYYKFGEILNRHRLIENNGEWVYEGEAIHFPENEEVWPVAKVPKGGYKESHDFDVLYSNLLRQLEEVWEGTLELYEAVATMRYMGNSARELMEKPLPPDPKHPDGNDPGNYGPSFLWIPKEAS